MGKPGSARRQRRDVLDVSPEQSVTLCVLNRAEVSKIITCRFVVGLLLVCGTFAVAADLPVRYTVDDKALKGAVAGTNLTFQLFSDAACSGSPAHSRSPSRTSTSSHGSSASPRPTDDFLISSGARIGPRDVSARHRT